MQQIARFRGDVLPPSLAVPFATMQQEFKGIDRTAARLAQMAAQRNLEQVDERLTDAIKNSVGVDISAALTQDGPIRQAMEDAVKANIDLITSIPEQYLARLKKGVEENFLGGSRASLAEQLYPELRRELGARYADNPPAYFEDMTPEEILDQVDQIAENRVRLIARDQTSKMNASFNQARQTSVGIEKYEWQTAGDERVRESHAELDGQVFSWDDPPEVDGEPANPGEPVNCRCVAIPFFDLDSEEE
jgi:SPP1 gp7 family putative phage head morphogenesis protein